MKHPWLDRIPIALYILVMIFLAYLLRDRALRGQNDFVQLYAGGRLAASPNLYDRAANLALIQDTIGLTMETVVYTRPPFYAALLWPLARLPYLAAYAIFSLASFCSVIWFVWRFSR